MAVITHYLPDSSQAEALRAHINYNETIESVPGDSLPGNPIALTGNSTGPSRNYILIAIGPDMGYTVDPSRIKEYRIILIYFATPLKKYTNAANNDVWSTWKWYNSQGGAPESKQGWIVSYNDHDHQWRRTIFINYWEQSDYMGGSWTAQNNETVYILNSTLSLQWDDEEYHGPEVDDRFFNKDPDEYTMIVGCRPTMDSAYQDSTLGRAYITREYNITIKWTSPVTGTAFEVPLTQLYNREWTAQQISNGGPIYWGSDFTIDSISRGVRCPNGTYPDIASVPDNFSELTDFGSVNSISLQWLKQQASTQEQGVTEQDLFTEIHAIFRDANTQEIVEDIVCDYSSLFGSDIDITGSTIPPEDINGSPDIDDDNIYTDHIDLTTPTLTASGVFNRTFAMNSGNINLFNDYIYNADDNIFDAILKSVLTPDRPLESVIDLRLYPFNVRLLTGATSWEKIQLGRIETPVYAYVIPNSAYTVIDLGTASINRRWHNFLDYMTTAQIYIPFCGVSELPIDKVINKKLNIKLIVDLVTGAGCAVVYAGGLPVLYRDCVVGISIPLTATNSAEWGKALMSNLVQTGSSIASTVAGAPANPIGIASQVTNIFDMAYQGPSVQQKGSSTPQTSLFEPKNAYIILAYAVPITEAWSDTYADLIGYACEIPLAHLGTMPDNTAVSGFSCFDNIKMNISGATESEKQHILDLLKNGVYM